MKDRLEKRLLQPGCDVIEHCKRYLEVERSSLLENQQYFEDYCQGRCPMQLRTECPNYVQTKLMLLKLSTDAYD